MKPVSFPLFPNTSFSLSIESSRDGVEFAELGFIGDKFNLDDA